MPALEYNHSYPTCEETFSTLRIFSDDTEPDTITKALNIIPTESFLKGASYGKGLRRKTHGWFYSTQYISDSKDTRYHIDLILGVLEGKTDVIDKLQHGGCELDIVSYWVSRGQGGPELWPNQMIKLGTMRIGVWWDVYFGGKDET